MDVREKLVELLQNAKAAMKSENLSCDIARNMFIVDFMMSNGVTVQERGYWASLTDCANAGVYCSVCHKKIYKEDYARCNRKNELRSDYCPHCGARMDGGAN